MQVSIKFCPDITVYCEELDQMYQIRTFEADKFQCDIQLPANPTGEDMVYHLRICLNGEPTDRVTTVTVLGKKLGE